MGHLPRPALSELNTSNGILTITDEPTGRTDEIEMHPMNNPSSEVSSVPAALSKPPDCFTQSISKHFKRCAPCIPKRFRQRWTYLRSRAHRLVENRYFEWLIIASILTSSTTLVSARESRVVDDW